MVSICGVMLASAFAVQAQMPGGISTVPPPPPPAVAPPFTPVLQDAALVTALQRGGYVLYMRHAATDQSRQDATMVDLANCDTQRMLSDDGRAQATTINSAFSTLNIPVGKVFASEYCRTKETAMLAFGRSTPEPKLTLSKEDRTTYLQIMTTAPIPGTNTLLVGHVPGITTALGLALNEGEIGIFDPSERDNPKFVARVMPNDWAGLPAR